ncbi:MAG TPA: glycosyltransferase family 87 protein, partial [Xanthobacteraceae bacterium]|nr:glycosyltransferase family 87 protein [Xanthobacteraceae bacterium]
FWAAGYQVLHGHAVDAYDANLHSAAQAIALGHPVSEHFPFIYPPPFLFVSAILALFPYVAAHLGWVLVTFAGYAAAIRSIIGARIGWLLAAAFPAVLADFASGQNGLLTAGLIGGALILMRQRPALAGCLLGCLIYKPQFAVLFPLVLVIDGRWRMIFSAAVTVILLVAASCAAFGVESWEAFFRALPGYSQVHLAHGEHWLKMQSVFIEARLLGGSETLAWIVHGIFAGAGVLALCGLWRSRASFELKAAALAVATVLVLPSLFLYDLPVLAVALAFLLREARTTGFLPYELASIGAACLLIFIFPVVTAPVGLAAALIIAALIARRTLALHIRQPGFAAAR